MYEVVIRSGNTEHVHTTCDTERDAYEHIGVEYTLQSRRGIPCTVYPGGTMDVHTARQGTKRWSVRRVDVPAGTEADILNWLNSFTPPPQSVAVHVPTSPIDAEQVW